MGLGKIPWVWVVATQIFLFSPLLREMIYFESYFSIGLVWNHQLEIDDSHPGRRTRMPNWNKLSKRSPRRGDTVGTSHSSFWDVTRFKMGKKTWENMWKHGGKWEKYIKQGLLGLLICRDERLLKCTAPGLFHEPWFLGSPLFQAYTTWISWKMTIFVCRASQLLMGLNCTCWG